MITPTQLVIDLILAVNHPSKPITTENITLGLPSVVTDTSIKNRNTFIKATAVPGKGWRGSQTFYYNRWDLGETFQNIPLKYVLAEGETIDRVGLASWLAGRHGIELSAADVVAGLLDLSVLPQNVKLVANVNSLAWKGQVDITLDSASLDLEQTLSVTTLDGLWLPSRDITKGQAQFYSYQLDGIVYNDSLVLMNSGSSVETTEFAALLSNITGDDWVVTTEANNFNLKGSSVVYNGMSGAAPAGIKQNPAYSKVMVIQLGSGCTNFGGCLTIWYGTKA